MSSKGAIGLLRGGRASGTRTGAVVWGCVVGGRAAGELGGSGGSPNSERGRAVAILDDGVVQQVSLSAELLLDDYGAWLAGHSAALELFFAQDAPSVGALDDPWTLQGLQAAVRVARTRIVDRRGILAPENRALIDRFGRFVGEVFVRQFDGSWTNVLDNAPPDVLVWPMVRCTGYLACIAPHSAIEIAIAQGRPEGPAATPDGILTDLYRGVQDKYLTWIANNPTSPYRATA